MHLECFVKGSVELVARVDGSRRRISITFVNLDEVRRHMMVVKGLNRSAE